jgi:hypothetical protein
MFEEVLNNTIISIEATKAVLLTNESIRDYFSGKRQICNRKELMRGTEPLLNKIFFEMPDEAQWRIYDRCSVVTRLYAIYENYVENLIREVLQSLPKIFVNYTDLDKSIQETYREGVGKILCDLNKSRYESLTISQVLQGIFMGVTAQNSYSLLPEAFLDKFPE